MLRYRFPASNPVAAADPPAALQPAAAQYPCVLETQFPHILQAIQALWGYPELNSYLEKLTIDNRGSRAGFPPAAWDEIYLLMRIHQHILPTPAL